MKAKKSQENIKKNEQMKQYETFVKKEKLDEKLQKIQQFKKLNEK